MVASFYKDILPLARSTQLVRGGPWGSYPRGLLLSPLSAVLKNAGFVVRAWKIFAVGSGFFSEILDSWGLDSQVTGGVSPK